MPKIKSPGSEPLQRTISLAADTSIVAVVGPAEGVLAVAIRHPGTGQPVDRVVVIALCGKQGRPVIVSPESVVLYCSTRAKAPSLSSAFISQNAVPSNRTLCRCNTTCQK